MNDQRYKFLYEIRQTNPKPGEAIYYRGSRISKVEPEKDFWKNYYTSSKLVEKKIKEDGEGAFEVVEIKLMPEDCNLLYEEHLYIVEVDARNNPAYFNQHNNEGYAHTEAGHIVCPHCYHKNYGYPFDPCFNCGKVMSEFHCVERGNELKSPTERCSCGYSRNDNIKHFCIKCGNGLKGYTERCSCGYSRLDDVIYKCRQCGNVIKSSTVRCGVCKISFAGCHSWKEKNPIYRLILKDQIIYEGYKHLCVEFLVNNLVCSKPTASEFIVEKGVFYPKRSTKKNINAFKYVGLKAELIPYPDDNDDSKKES